MNKKKYYKIKDNIAKMQLVSLYGSFINKGFRYYNPNMVNSLTSVSRVTILGLIEHLKDYKHIFSAADSVAFSGDNLDEKVNDFLKKLSNITETESNIVMEKECYNDGIFLTGNNYILIDKDNKYIFKGITRNKFVRKSVKQIIKLLLKNENNSFIVNEIDIIFENFKKLDLDEIVIIEKALDFNNAKNKSKIKNGIIAYNNFLFNNSLQNKYSKIYVGDSIKYFYSGREIICYKNIFPEEMKVEINYEKQFNLLFKKLATNILKCFDMKIKTSGIDDFLNF